MNTACPHVSERLMSVESRLTLYADVLIDDRDLQFLCPNVLQSKVMRMLFLCIIYVCAY